MLLPLIFVILIKTNMYRSPQGLAHGDPSCSCKILTSKLDMQKIWPRRQVNKTLLLSSACSLFSMKN